MLPADFDKFPRRLGPYVVTQLLAEGGTGRVYLALMGSRRSPQPCVIKQLGSTWSGLAPQQLAKLEQRFRREAEITMTLAHPAIARTFAFHNQPPQPPYFVQELIDGFDLRALVSRLSAAAEPIPIPLVAHVVLEVAGVLVYLHELQARGLVHRDVSPDNVMVSVTGEVKLIDFGVARIMATSEPASQPQLVGKMNWMAPEMVRGAPPDPRVDVFALGLLTWYLLTGRDPATTLSYQEAPRGRLPPSSSFNPQVSIALDRVVAQATDPDPVSRLQTAREFRRALAVFLTPGYPAETELALMVQRARGVGRLAQRQRLVDEGRWLLGDSAAPSPGGGAVAAGARRRRGTLTALLGSVVVLLAVVFLGVRAEQSFDVQLVHSRPPAAAGAPSLAPAPTPVSAVPAPTLAAVALARPAAEASEPPALAAPVRAPLVARQRPRPGRGLATNTRAGRRSADGDPGQILAAALDLFERGELPEALRQARMATGRGSGAPAFVLVGRILAVQGDLGGARAAFETALRAQPDDAEAKRRLARLRLASPESVP